MKNCLLTIALLIGTTSLVSAQGERQKPTSRGSSLYSVNVDDQSKSGKQLLQEKMQLQTEDDLLMVSNKSDKLGYDSGVGNHWFYLLSVGGSGTNDLGDSYSVTGIGVEEAGAINWRTESVYLTSTSDYEDWRTYSIISAEELYGDGSAEEIAVTNAWYAVGVGAAYPDASDTIPPTSPSALVASSISGTSFVLSWTAGTDNVAVTGYEIYQDGSYLQAASGTSSTITGLIPGGTYEYFVITKDAGGNSSAPSDTLSVTTDSTAITYCSASGSTTAYEYIDYVGLGSISNTTGADGGYGDYTALSTTVSPGSSYTLYLSAGFSGSTYRENWKFYIDYNQDGDFTDSGENILSGSTTGSGTYYTTITIPSTATTGSTRMRAIMAYGTSPSSCSSFTYGEVEDYTITISAGASIMTMGETLSTTQQDAVGNLDDEMYTLEWHLFPNPASSTLNISSDGIKTISSVRIIDLSGKEIKYISKIEDNQVNIADLSPGIYLAEIMTERGKLKTKFIKQ